MLATASVFDRSYAGEVPALLAALPRSLGAPPLELLGVTATLYLRPYLTASEHRAAMNAAFRRAWAEAASWNMPPGDPAQREQYQPATGDGGGDTQYTAIWRRAIAGGTGRHLVLAQHACEIAELLDWPARHAALRLGLLLPLEAPTALPNPPSEPVPLPGRSGSAQRGPAPDGDPLELLSRALLGSAIGRATFVERLLALHALNRGTELTGGWSEPRVFATRLVAGLPHCDRTPNRLRAVQPHELARRAVRSASALAILAVEAGLAEATTSLPGRPGAEQLTNGRRLLLLAALDRAITGNENRNDRY